MASTRSRTSMDGLMAASIRHREERRRFDPRFSPSDTDKPLKLLSVLQNCRFRLHTSAHIVSNFWQRDGIWFLTEIAQIYSAQLGKTPVGLLPRYDTSRCDRCGRYLGRAVADDHCAYLGFAQLRLLAPYGYQPAFARSIIAIETWAASL